MNTETENETFGRQSPVTTDHVITVELKTEFHPDNFDVKNICNNYTCVIATDSMIKSHPKLWTSCSQCHRIFWDILTKYWVLAISGDEMGYNFMENNLRN